MDEQSLFIEALEKHDPAGRAAFLDCMCAGDAALRQRLEKLLQHHQQADNFLKSPTSAWAAIAELIPERPGTVIGSYKLLEQIGEGGFGVVFLAEQQRPVRRTEALKVLKPGMDMRQIIARFEAERQALALMDHPNIAKVLDGGETASGRPYFVMDLVKGVPITQYCDEQQLTPRQRLELFIPVCQAIQHAHHKGIIHRDIKPSNVLVAAYDSPPVPKVIDFGVAKALGQRLTDRTLVTGFGGIIGTLEYMSPEQADFNALDVDTRSDIYSLGVLLYELLTGTTPLTRERLKQTPVSEVLRLIREEEPPKPSTRLSDSKNMLASVSAQRNLEPMWLAREMRGELDWIVMKCLEKDRSRRYETANGLARDIERYMKGEPVEACPPSAGYRLWKFLRKNRKWITVAAAFGLLLACAAGVSAWLAVRATAAESRALTALAGEAEQRQKAVKSAAEAKAVLEFFKEKVLSAVRPKGQEGGLGPNATIRAALDHAEPEIAKAFAEQPLVEASIRNQLGVSYWFLNDWDAALRQQERALELRRREMGANHADTVGVMNDVGIILRAQGKLAEANRIFAEVVEAKRRTLGPEHPITLRSANNLAVALAEQGLFEEASKLAEATLQIQRRVDGPETVFTLRSAYNLGIMWRYLGRFDQARSQLNETLATLRRAFGPEHQDTLRVVVALGELLLDQGQPAEARRLFEEALQAQRKMLGPTYDETLLTMVDLADALRAEGNLEAAGKLIDEAVTLHIRRLGAEHPQTLVARAMRADVLRDWGQLADARKLYEETLPVERRVFAPRAPELQKLIRGFAWMLTTAADTKFRDPRRAVELAKEVIGHAPNFADHWTTLGVATYRAGDWKDAAAALEKAESLAPGKYAEINAFFVAMAQRRLGNDTAARRWYDQAVERMDKNQPENEELRRSRAEATELLKVKQKND